MSTLKQNVGSSTSERIMLGPGILYADYENGTGTNLGMFFGGSFELATSLYDLRPPGAKGPVKGLQWIDERVAKISVDLAEITRANLERLVAGADTVAWSNSEAVGTGDGSTKAFELDNTPDSTVALKVFVDGTESELTTDYTVSGTTITFVTAPTSDAVITADYTYAGTPSSGDFWRISGDTTIAAADYLTNLVLVCEWTGDSADGAMLQIDNPLATGALSLSLPEQQHEVIHTMEWTANYDSSDMDREPWAYFLPDGN